MSSDSFQANRMRGRRRGTGTGVGRGRPSPAAYHNHHNGSSGSHNNLGSGLVGHGRGRGVGRGRGRGHDINMPAWMSSSEAPRPPPPQQPQTRHFEEKYEKRESRHMQQENHAKKDAATNRSMSQQSRDLNQEKMSQKKEPQEKAPQEQREQKQQHLLEKQDEEQLQKLVQESIKNHHHNESNNNDEEEKMDSKRNDIDDVFTSLFKTKEEQEEELAIQRRAKRKARLKQIAPTLGKETEKPSMHFVQEMRQDLKEEGNEIVHQNNTEENNQPSKRRKLNENENDHEHTNLSGTGNNESNQHNSGNDSFDMFASTSPLSSSSQQNKTNTEKQDSLTAATNTARPDDNDVQNYNDSEGYYKATTGEIITFAVQQQSGDNYTNNQKDDVAVKAETKSLGFKVIGTVGKGVFSTVLKCSLLSKQSNDPNQQKEGNTNELDQTPVIVAMKLIRSNEVMTKAAEKEVRILRMLRSKSSGSRDSNNHFIVRMLELEDFEQSETNNSNQEEHSVIKNRNNRDNVFFKQRPILEYRNHTILLFDYMPNNLRQVLSKFGKNVGINLSSVKSYAKQLLLALKHLSLHGIIHADIKLDNILVTSNWTTIKLCDFGSALLESDEEFINHIPTPYLVSRFYRAPEIILGLPYNKMIDLWSVAVSLAELFTGNVFFSGRTNNDMIKRFMEAIGPLSNKMIRRHIAAFTKMGLKPHFELHAGGGGNFDFRQQDFDKVTGKPIIRIQSASQDHNVTVPSKQISQVMLQSRSGSDNRGDVLKLSDFLQKCLTLDPAKRISIDDALKHDLFGK